jgi:hypothetical protein
MPISYPTTPRQAGAPTLSRTPSTNPIQGVQGAQLGYVAPITPTPPRRRRAPRRRRG